jgi:protein TonB
MTAHSLATPLAERFGETRPALVRTDAYPHAMALERAVYQSRQLSPGSAVAALTLAAAAFSSFQYLGSPSAHKQEHPLTVITLVDLAKPPPPPEPDEPVRRQHEVAQVRPKIVVPPPIVTTPAPAPAVAVADVPAPRMPAPVAAEPTIAKAESGPPAASPAAAEGGDLSSRMISAQPPTYPVDSRRLREQGTVVLSVLLATDGRVERLSIARSSGFPRLDHAASSAVRRWRWSPTMRDGQPVPVQGNVVIPFVLRG